MSERFGFRVERCWHTDSFRIYAIRWERDGGAFRPLSTPTLGEPTPEGAYVESVEPLLTVDSRSAQALFDDLWHAGFRPKQDQSDGERAAMKAHIEDLRVVMLRTLPALIDKEPRT